MAIHDTQTSMQKEALQELIEVAEYCINFDKNKDPRWKGDFGCYGYPAASILLSIVDSLGAIVEGGGDDVGIHFKILNNPKWYDCNFSQNERELLEKAYRNKLVHNSHIREGVTMSSGDVAGKILEYDIDGYPTLFLVPFLQKSKKVVSQYIHDVI